MSLQDISFTGLIQNRNFSEITATEFSNALKKTGWREQHGTHFFRALKEDGPRVGIATPRDLQRAVAKGRSTPGRDGTTLHRITGTRSAYVVYNATTKVLVTFSDGDPKGLNLREAIRHLRRQAVPSPGVGACARIVREALEAGGLKIQPTGHAKDYGPHLIQSGFAPIAGDGRPFREGDIVVIEGFLRSAAPGIHRDHASGHMAMFDGVQWISDYKQSGTDPYPGSDYDKAKPRFVIFRIIR